MPMDAYRVFHPRVRPANQTFFIPIRARNINSRAGQATAKTLDGRVTYCWHFHYMQRGKDPEWPDLTLT